MFLHVFQNNLLGVCDILRLKVTSANGEIYFVNNRANAVQHNFVD